MPNNLETDQNQTSASLQTGEPPKIEIRDRITRETVRAEKDKIFLFGDDLLERNCAAKRTPPAFRLKKRRAIIRTRFLTTRNLPPTKKRLTKPSAKFRPIKLLSFQRRRAEPDSRSSKKKPHRHLPILTKNSLKSALVIQTKNPPKFLQQKPSTKIK